MNHVSHSYITFKLTDYLLALPSESILKIVATPPPSQGGMVSMGLVQLEQYSIQILDLPKLLGLKETISTIHALAPSSDKLIQASAAQNPPFLIVIRNADKGLWAIAVDEPPDLIDIPNHALSPVPAETRLPGALQWVSHVATCEFSHNKLNESHACLVLDLSALLLARQADISSHQPEFLEIKPPLDLDNIDIDNTGEVNKNIRERVHLQLPVLNLSEKH